MILDPRGRPVAVRGAAHGRFGRRNDVTLQQLMWEAVSAALAAAQTEPGEIDAVFVGNVFGPTGVASRVVRDCGLATGVPVTRVETACASGSVALDLAIRGVESGRWGTVLALGIEQLSALFDGAIGTEKSDAEGAAGLPLPGLYALQASWYLEKYRREAEELAAVAVKNRAMGALNPLAQRQQAVTSEEVNSSRMIATPLTVLQCCPVSDGAAAAVIGRARPGRADLPVLASAVAGGRAWPGEHDEAWGMASVRRAARMAEKESGIELSGADVLEVHDAFTIGEVLTLEAMGLCAPGHALDELADGTFRSEGRLPVNCSGGLLSRGHALGATGIAQVAEIRAQLTGEAGPRQVPGTPRVGVLETMGGGASGLDGNTAAVIVLGAAG